MEQFLQRDIDYVIRLNELLWGCALLAVTLSIHGVGIFNVTRVSGALLARTKTFKTGIGTGIIILVAWMIVAVHLLEVVVWAAFFTWKGAQPNIFSAFYNALVNYTTLAAGYLPVRWRLLEGMLGMAGLLSFAWSTSALIAIAEDLMRRALKRRPQEY